jgi:hypothetical protein
MSVKSNPGTGFQASESNSSEIMETSLRRSRDLWAGPRSVSASFAVTGTGDVAVIIGVLMHAPEGRVGAD